MYHFIKNISFLALALLISACNVINPKEEIPAFLEVKPFEFSPGIDGSTSNKITDGWIYVGGEFLGAFDLPKTIPVYATGEQNILVDPGIKMNGINASPDIYPFYSRYTTSVTLVPGETVSIQPGTTYDQRTKFVFTEGFEGSIQKFTDELDQDPTTNMVIEEDPNHVFEGDGIGLMHLEKDSPLLAVGSTLISEFPASGSTMYLELDYKTDLPLLVGIIGYDDLGSQRYSLVDKGVNPKSEWTKVYFNLTESIITAQQLNSSAFQIVLQSQIPIVDGEFAIESADIYVDNIKIVQF